jgi:predicted membrane-bound mannosyltransferase
MAVCTVHYPKKSLVERLRPALMAVAFGATLALAAILRFWDLGIRTFQGDESVSSLIASQFARGRGYEQLAALHGPVHYVSTALAFHALGTNDSAARAMPALFGVLLAALPLMFTRHIGRVGAAIAALLIAISPTMLYYSRFAGPDIYLAFFSLATAMLAWRYLAAPERVYLYLMSATLAFMLVTSEMALVVVAIFAAYLHYRVAVELIDQAREPRRAENEPLTHYELIGVAEDVTTRDIRAAFKLRLDRGKNIDREALTNALHVLTTPARREAYDRKLAQRRVAAPEQSPEPRVGLVSRAIFLAGAGAIAAFWPVIGVIRRRTHVSRRPDAASPLMVVVLLTLPFFGPLVEKLSFIGDRGFAGQQPVLTLGSTLTVTPPGGEVPVMMITLGVLFGAAAIIGIAWRWHVFVVCWATFYGITITMFTGFFTNSGGMWTGLWGTLDYWWRPEARHVDGPAYYYAMTLPAYEIAPIAISVLAVAAMLILGGWRNRIVAVATCLALAGIVGAPTWVQPIAEYRTLLVLVAASGAILALRLPELTKFLAFWAVAAFGAFTMIGHKDAALAMHVALPLALLAAKLVNDAVSAFEMPAVAMPALPTMPPFALVAPRRLAQATVLAAVLAASVFTVRTGVLASWGHGSTPQLSAIFSASDHGDAPIELLHADEIAPDVREVRAAIEQAGVESGKGTSVPIAVDTSYDFAQGWLWYLRDYPNLTIQDMRRGYQAPAGTIVLFDNRNRDKVLVDGTSAALAFTSKWSFPGPRAPLSRGEVASNLASAGWWSDWSKYLLDRTRAGEPETVQGVVYFPRELSAALPHPLTSDVLASSVEPPLYGPPAP